MTARVTAQDAEIADAKAAKLNRTEDGVTGLLFTVPDHGPTAHMLAQDRAAVGIALTWGPGLWDLDETRLLRVIHATGRVHRRDEESTPSLHVGAVMLGGEIAARYLYQQLAGEHGPHGLEPLAAAVATLWPLPDETPPPVHGHLGMALFRLTQGPYETLLSADEIKAMQLLGRAMPGGIDQGTQVRCVARACHHIVHQRNQLHAENLAAVREEILTVRTAGQPQPVNGPLGWARPVGHSTHRPKETL
ncbi:hypothetical protein [Streptomyces sp. NPDC088915]|uniref:hypothetical protein n=1 Tax=Streptomyces sp. NPDC088915 TaxID=3365912 RepID=UPI0038147A40